MALIEYRSTERRWRYWYGCGKLWRRLEWGCVV